MNTLSQGWSSQRGVETLIVDANREDIEFLELAFLHANDYQFETLQTYKLSDALQILDQRHVDVVLLNLFLPDSQGVETYKKIQNLYPDMPVIVLTNFDGESDAVDAITCGAQSYFLQDEFGHHLLAREIRQAIKRKQFDRQQREREREKARAEVAAQAAHEFGQPLSTIMGLADVLLMQNQGDAQQKEMLKDISQASARINEVVQNMKQ